MSNCGTCKHWGNRTDVGETFRACGAVIHDDRSRYSMNPDDYPNSDEWNDEIRNEIIAIRKHRAVVVDGSGYFAALKCREDFGCVLYAPSRAKG